LQSTFHKWERISPDMGDQAHVAKELVATCGSIEWQVLVFSHGSINLVFIYNLAGVE